MILLDSNICTAIIRGEPRAASRLLQGVGRVFLPFTVSAELYFGVEKLERKGIDVRSLRAQVDALHGSVQGLVHSSRKVCGEYARLRAFLEAAGTPIGPNDLWIAAQALAEDALLVTDNTREFKRVPGLRIENWLR